MYSITMGYINYVLGAFLLIKATLSWAHMAEQSALTNDGRTSEFSQGVVM